jgi:hypothetical protein
LFFGLHFSVETSFDSVYNIIIEVLIFDAFINVLRGYSDFAEDVEFPAGCEYVMEPEGFTAFLPCLGELLILHINFAGY